MRNRRIQTKSHLSECKRKDYELPVHGNLTVTPAHMLKMAERGTPISTNNLEFKPSDGEQNPSWDIPLDRLRGVDPAEMWEQSQVVKQKAKRAHDTDRRVYGDKDKED